jgi:ATP-dependent Lhr-like helicase
MSGVDDAVQRTRDWFDQQQWTVFDFQEQAWQAWHNGESGLIHSPTGSGKTLAAWLGPVQAVLMHKSDTSASASASAKAKTRTKAKQAARSLQVLWITPLRALANDTCEQLQASADALDADVRVEVRTGDTSSSRRSRQLGDPPFALITTPESLSVMLSYANADKTLRGVHTVVVDEWHELLGSKRGVQLQLCLARLRLLNPGLRVWGVSATLANLDQAMATLIGTDQRGTLIRGVMPKSVEVDSVLPQSDQHFRWSGHLGVQLVEPVARVIESARSSLVFTNTRSQAELWYQALLEHKPEWLCSMALHHGSLDRKLRQQIEEKLRCGELICVVCTSSLDLGVDFSPVDQVLQIGSPKGIGRLLQRAGRSGHQPGAVSRVVCVPTHAFELVEIASVRRALESRRIEPRESPVLCLDVLCQHLVTIAMGGGFVASDMLAEVQSTHAFSAITEVQWQWVLDFITRGGQALQGYPQYHKVLDVNGRYRVIDRTIAQRHRMSIGTITSDAQINVAYQRGKRLGTTEESFIARLKPGDTFQFAGRHLELLRVRDMTATVKNATRRSGAVPRWWGTQMPISTELADSVLQTLNDWRTGGVTTPELQAVEGMLRLQQQWSMLPGPDDFLLEMIKTREGYSVFCFPFAGRLAHEGLAMLVAQRLSTQYSITLTLQVNDYGFELQSSKPIELDTEALKAVFCDSNLLDDVLASVNSGEIAKRQFRSIARVAGLVFNGYPGRSKSAKQVQASSGLIYDVFENYDQDNLLLDQARREVLQQQLEYQRLLHCLNSLQQRQWHLLYPERLTPLSFPLWADSVQSQTFSSESFQDRVSRMLGSLERAADKTLGQTATESA